MKIKSQEAAAQVLKEFEESLAAIKAHQYLVPGMPVEGYILQFENGLALKVHGPHQVHVCGIVHASVFMSAAHAKQAPAGLVSNGNGEPALPVKLFEACEKEIAKLEKLIKEVNYAIIEAPEEAAA